MSHEKVSVSTKLKFENSNGTVQGGLGDVFACFILTLTLWSVHVMHIYVKYTFNFEFS